MSPIDAIKSVFTNYANFKGVAARSEYWWWYLFSTVVGGVLNAMTGDTENPNMFVSLLVIVWGLGTLVPGLAVIVRRFHDAGFSGKWLLLWILPLVVTIGSIPVVVQAYMNAYSIEDFLLAMIGSLTFAFLSILAVGIFQFVITLMPSKSAEAGNTHV